MMVEWILIGVLWATAIAMIAHTIDEALWSAMPPCVRSHRFPNSLSREEQPASCVQHGNTDEAHNARLDGRSCFSYCIDRDGSKSQCAEHAAKDHQRCSRRCGSAGVREPIQRDAVEDRVSRQPSDGMPAKGFSIVRLDCANAPLHFIRRTNHIDVRS